jgi:alkyl sulfatase BDS1-like metallo-beta-lactamase superfamily hydrolase
MVFQLTPGTEAPAEMNFYVPASRAVFMAENANLTMHNLLPARGALVRDAKAWADYLTESIRLFAGKSDVMFAAHGIPRFGTSEIATFLTSHRNAYKYLHDQTVRLMNAGFTATEIAEVIRLPDVLARQWFNRGYYGTMSHNSKAIYQRYIGWYDANPAHLNPLPPEPASKKYVEAMGGIPAVMALAEKAIRADELRWAATLLNHAVFADGSNEATGVVKFPAASMSVDVLAATTTPMLLDFAAVRVNPDKAVARSFRLNLELTDRGETHLITIEDGVMIHEAGVADSKAGATVRMKRPDLLLTLLAGTPPKPLIDAGQISVTGDPTLYEALADMIEPVVANFPIVTP